MISVKKVLFVILDGYSEGVFGESALSAANKSRIDFVARKSFAGLIENKLGNHPDSGISTFVLLGYDKDDYPGRGYLDALGAGLEPAPNDVCIRANFANVEETKERRAEGREFEMGFVVRDRRAGRNYEGLFDLSKAIASINLEGIRFAFKKSVGHRGVLVLHGTDISQNVSDSDPGKEGLEVTKIMPYSKDSAAEHTAATLNKWEHETHLLLKDNVANKFRKPPINFILLRGASSPKELKSFKDMYGLKATCVAASPAVKGLCKAIGMETPTISGATADLKSDVAEKARAAVNALDKNDFVLLHILSPDVAAHDRSPVKKRMAIEKIDSEVFKRIVEYVDFSKTVLVVASDHPTSAKSGEHMAGIMPFLIFTNGIESTGAAKLSEDACKVGPIIDIDDFMEKVMSYR